jgi:hypothetical protein
MTEKEQILIRILSRTDAIFWPCRSWQGCLQQTLAEHRKRYLSGSGVPWHSASLGGRSNPTRLLSELEQAESIQCFREATKVRFARLTPESETTTRALIGLSSRAAGLLTLKKLKEARVEKDHFRAGWISEKELTGCDYNSPKIETELLIVQNFSLSALAAGWVEFNSSTLGHGFYRITPSGREHLTDSIPDDEYQPDRKAREVYLNEFKIFQGWLSGQEPEKSNEIYVIPLPVG